MVWQGDPDLSCWRWREDWEADTIDMICVGTYDDVLRGGMISKVSELELEELCLSCPSWISQPYSETASVRFKSSKL